jgi:hypothetical protein
LFAACADQHTKPVQHVGCGAGYRGETKVGGDHQESTFERLLPMMLATAKPQVTASSSIIMRFEKGLGPMAPAARGCPKALTFVSFGAGAAMDAETCSA